MMPAALGVDTSNYATSLALYRAGEVVYTDKRLLPVPPGGLGLRQSEALFHHTQALPQMINKMQAAGVLAEVAAVGVSARPCPVRGSYMPCFTAGKSFAAAYAAALGLSLFQTTHQEGHVAAALYGAGPPAQALWQNKYLAVHLSGGTTELLLCQGTALLQLLGGSLDLFAGQAIDRLGVRLGFAFPAGEELSNLAAPFAGEEVRPKISVMGMDCHLSGLQNQCERMLDEGKEAGFVAYYCLAAIADTVLAMVQEAGRHYPGLPLLCAGGVMSSEIVRGRLQKALPRIYFAPPSYSGDNAAGVALLAAKNAGL